MPKLYEFTVEGLLSFPFDMLRYDRCWPARGEDAEMLATWNLSRNPQVCRVTLRSDRRPEEARWDSFGWKVTQVKVL